MLSFGRLVRNCLAGTLHSIVLCLHSYYSFVSPERGKKVVGSVVTSTLDKR